MKLVRIKEESDKEVVKQIIKNLGDSFSKDNESQMKGGSIIKRFSSI